MINIAVMGHGTVGSGVVDVLTQNKNIICSRVKNDIFVKYILDLRKFPDLPYSEKFTDDFNIILNDESVKIVVEVMGGTVPAFEYTKKCLLAGKSIVTSNKELVAEYGATLFEIAEKNNVNFMFEASVGGGIPIIRPLYQCLAANEVNEILGILNGTTNFILTKMISEGMSFDNALTLAKQLGYAEKNPSADIDGHDACRKICILSALAYNRHVYPHQVYTEGISKIESIDVGYASSCGCVIKLVGKTRLTDKGLECIVCPMFIKKNNPLSTVDDVFNAIKVNGDMTGDVMFYGKGAGKLPTASAVVADIMDCVKHINSRKYLSWQDGYEGYVIDHLEYDTSMYIRFSYDNEKTAKEKIRQIFGSVEFLSCFGADENESAFITSKMKEKEILSNLDKLSSYIKTLNKIRVCE